MSGVLSQSQDRPVYQQLGDIIRADIQNGVYAPGSTLPSETAMCERYHIGRATVRRAIAVLREEGLVSTKRGEQPLVRGSGPRDPVTLGPGDRLMARMPSQPERTSLQLAAGTPILEITRGNGVVELHPADRIEIVGSNRRP